MRWPWQSANPDPEPSRERRENSPFTDAVIAGILAASQTSQQGDSSALGALETAAGLWARAFASAKISPMNRRTEAITPSILALIGRTLIRRGELVFAIKMIDGELALIPGGTWDVRGPYNESEWLYRVDLFGASEHSTELIPSAGVVHARYAVDPTRPWIGLAPLHWARLTGTLAANVETRLGEESGAPVGSFIPIPDQQDPAPDEDDDDNHDPLAQLKLDVRAAKGRQMLVESMMAGWGVGGGGAPRGDFRSERFGSNPPQAVINLMDRSALAVLNACGVPVALATDADGTSQRESWRRFVMGSVEPIAKIVAEELSRKLDTDVQFDFGGLWAHDLAGRASAFKGMVAAGMEIDRAAALSGLMMD